jgi:Tfp pilus assembly PilM family ATPase
MMGKVFNKSVSQRKVNDLVGVDLGTTATKVVRLKKSKEELTLAGIDLLPPVDFTTAASRMELPRSLTSNYGCLAYSSSAAVVRMVNYNLPAESSVIPEKDLRRLLNVSDDFRVSASLVRREKGRQDSGFLAVAIPQDDVRYLLNMFPSGPPAPASLEVSGLAFVPAFLNARRKEIANEAVCLIEAGETFSSYLFINKGVMSLVGKMDFGIRTLQQKLVADLGVDEELATSILNDQSINISASLSSVMLPFIKQLSISKDFIERHQGCRIKSVYVSGGMSLLPSFSNEVEQMLHVDVKSWSPFENIGIEPGFLSEELSGQATRFSAAIGAAIGGFQES